MAKARKRFTCRLNSAEHLETRALLTALIPTPFPNVAPTAFEVVQAPIQNGDPWQPAAPDQSGASSHSITDVLPPFARGHGALIIGWPTPNSSSTTGTTDGDILDGTVTIVPISWVQPSFVMLGTGQRTSGYTAVMAWDGQAWDGGAALTGDTNVHWANQSAVVRSELRDQAELSAATASSTKIRLQELVKYDNKTPEAPSQMMSGLTMRTSLGQRMCDHNRAAVGGDQTGDPQVASYAADGFMGIDIAQVNDRATEEIRFGLPLEREGNDSLAAHAEALRDRSALTLIHGHLKSDRLQVGRIRSQLELDDPHPRTTHHRAEATGLSDSMSTELVFATLGDDLFDFSSLPATHTDEVSKSPEIATRYSRLPGDSSDEGSGPESIEGSWIAEVAKRMVSIEWPSTFSRAAAVGATVLPALMNTIFVSRVLDGEPQDRSSDLRGRLTFWRSRWDERTKS